MSKKKPNAKNDNLSGLGKLPSSLNLLDLEAMPPEAAINGMISNMIELLHHQMRLAFDLTQLIVEKNADPMNEQAILSVFKKVTQVVVESLPAEELFGN